MGMGYGMGESLKELAEKRLARLAARYGTNAPAAALVEEWREDVAHMYASGLTDDPVIEHVAIARAHDADELEKAIAPKKKPGRPKSKAP